MNDILLDKCLLFFYCMLRLMTAEPSPELILTCLTAVTVSSLNFAFQDSDFPRFSCLCYGLLTLFFPDFSVFLPLVAYDWNLETPRRFRPQDALTLAACLCSISGLLRFYAKDRYFLFLLFGLLLAALLRQRTRQYLALHRRYQKTRDDDTELQILLEEKNQSLRERQDSELYAATLRERNRIAREIHDNVGHMLTRSILMTGALRMSQGPELAEPLQQLEDTLNQAMNSIRQSVHDLRDSSVNLEEALQALIQDYTFCPVDLQFSMSSEVPKDVKYSFIAIIKEALVNISRHSNASRASVTAIEHPGFYQLVILDNGTVRNPKAPVKTSEGMGLANMESRIKSLNGSIQFQRKEGFRIYIIVPKK